MTTHYEWSFLLYGFHICIVNILKDKKRRKGMVYDTKVIEQADRIIVVFQKPDAETRDVVKKTFGVNSLIDQLGLASRTPAPKNIEEDVNKAIELDEHPELKDMDAAVERLLEENVPMPLGLVKLLINDRERCNNLGIENILWIMQLSLKPDTKMRKDQALAELDNMEREKKINVFNRLKAQIVEMVA